MPATITPTEADIPRILADIRNATERPMPTPVLLKADQAAAYCGMSRTSFDEAVKRGDMPDSVVTPGGYRWRVADLDRWVAKLKRRDRQTSESE